MKINFLKEKEENKDVKPFIEEYLSTYYSWIKEIDVNCPDEENRQGNQPDYFLERIGVAIELKRVYDSNHLSQISSVGYSVKRLQTELDKVSNKLSKNKIYLLEYPWNFKVNEKEAKEVSKKIIEAIEKNVDKISINNVGFFRITDEYPSKTGETKVILAFSIDTNIYSNPTEIIRQNVNLSKVNKQLGNIKANKRILLLVNNFYDNNKDYFIESLSYSYNDLLKRYTNIDEIWLQIKTSTNKFVHILLYTKRFLNSFDKGNFKEISSDNINLFQSWFYPLSKLGDEYNEKLFIALKYFLKDKKAYEVFSDSYKRSQMVQLGIWLAEKKRFNDVIWIIEKFIDDIDPPEPEKYSTDDEFNYHKKIENGEVPIIITSVLGHLCWVIQKLAVNKEYIGKSLIYTQKLLSHKNLYVKFQAMVPLVEISARRQWLNGWGKRPRVGEYKLFHNIVFELLNLVKENSNYKVIINRLCDVFSYYKDLSTEETEEVLETLKISEESAGLFIYFSVFRERHYRDQQIDYNALKIEEKFRKILESNKSIYNKFQSKTSWYLWKILKENKNEFKTLQPYVELLLKKPYDRDIHSHIERIIKDFINDEQDICIKWYNQLLDKVLNFVDTNKINIFILFHTNEIINGIAKNRPDNLLEVMKKLISLWEKNIYIGEIKNIFESYKLISDNSKKIKIKEEFKRIYERIKRMYPKIEIINWD